jgi:hypothetical protein
LAAPIFLSNASTLRKYGFHQLQIKDAMRVINVLDSHYNNQIKNSVGIAQCETFQKIYYIQNKYLRIKETNINSTIKNDIYDFTLFTNDYRKDIRQVSETKLTHLILSLINEISSVQAQQIKIVYEELPYNDDFALDLYDNNKRLTWRDKQHFPNLENCILYNKDNDTKVVTVILPTSFYVSKDYEYKMVICPNERNVDSRPLKIATENLRTLKH